MAQPSLHDLGPGEVPPNGFLSLNKTLIPGLQTECHREGDVWRTVVTVLTRGRTAGLEGNYSTWERSDAGARSPHKSLGRNSSDIAEIVSRTRTRLSLLLQPSAGSTGRDRGQEDGVRGIQVEI